MQEQRGGTGRLGLSDRKREADEATEAGVAGPAPQACATVFLGHTTPRIMLSNLVLLHTRLAQQVLARACEGAEASFQVTVKSESQHFQAQTSIV